MTAAHIMSTKAEKMPKRSLKVPFSMFYTVRVFSYHESGVIEQ